jgi:uncharacterized protein YecA (UPF0149 family)
MTLHQATHAVRALGRHAAIVKDQIDDPATPMATKILHLVWLAEMTIANVPQIEQALASGTMTGRGDDCPGFPMD